jgi:hypothetical protein
MKKMKWFFGMFFVFLALIACDKNNFEKNTDLGINDLNVLAIETIDEGGAFAYGTHVFTTEIKSNPDNLPSLNITKNRWGWANNQQINAPIPYVPLKSTYDIVIYPRNNYDPTFQTRIPNGMEIWNDALNLYIKIPNPVSPVMHGIISIEPHDFYGHQLQKVFNFSSTNNTCIIPFSDIGTICDGMYGFYGCGNTLKIYVANSEIFDGTYRQWALEELSMNTYHIAYTTSCHPSITKYYLNNVSENYGIVELSNDNDNFYMTFYITRNQAEGFGRFVLKAPKIGITLSSTPSGENFLLKTISHSMRQGSPRSFAYTVMFPLSEFSQIPNYTIGNPVYVQLVNTNIFDIDNTAAIIPVEFSNSINEQQNGFHPYNFYSPNAKPNEYAIYMGAGLNDTTKGSQVGIAYVDYDGDELKVKYDLLDEYLMSELHIYAKDIAPTKIAPGQFGFTQSFEIPVNEFETTLDVVDTNGDNKIWLILHASVIKL